MIEERGFRFFPRGLFCCALRRSVISGDGCLLTDMVFRSASIPEAAGADLPRGLEVRRLVKQCARERLYRNLLYSIHRLSVLIREVRDGI
jgi:hypothetical protein